MSSSNPGAPRVKVWSGEGFAVVTLDDPARRNALSVEMSDDLVSAFDELESTTEVRAVVVTGAPPAFCAGADLAQLVDADEGSLRRIYAGFVRVARSPLFTVAAVNGAAVGAGINLALACDVRVAAESARFDTRFLSLGLHPGGGHTHLLRRCLSQSAALGLLLSGDAVDGREAARLGLAYRCVEDDRLLEASRLLVHAAASAPRALVERCKASVVAASASDLDVALERELGEQLRSLSEPFFAERMTALRRRVGR
jgi:enoyl-CoA hydratase